MDKVFKRIDRIMGSMGGFIYFVNVFLFLALTVTFICYLVAFKEFETTSFIFSIIFGGLTVYGWIVAGREE